MDQDQLVTEHYTQSGGNEAVQQSQGVQITNSSNVGTFQGFEFKLVGF